MCVEVLFGLAAANLKVAFFSSVAGCRFESARAFDVRNCFLRIRTSAFVEHCVRSALRKSHRYTQTYICTCTHACAQMKYVSTCKHVRTYTYIHLFIYEDIHGMHAHIYQHTYTHACMDIKIGRGG